MNTRMLCYKAWLDTRARFVLGIVILTCIAVLLLRVWLGVEGYVMSGAVAPPVSVNGFFLFWFSQGLPQLWCLFAILLGSGGLVAQAAGRDGALFMLALPVSRVRLVLARAGVVLIELYLLALLPLLLVAIVAPSFGRIYASLDVFVVAFSMVTGGAIFFAVPFFLSSLFEQAWGPLVVMLSISVVITFARSLNPDLSQYTLASLLRSGDYLTGGSLPWMGLINSAAVSLALIALAVRNIARRDF